MQTRFYYFAFIYRFSFMEGRLEAKHDLRQQR